MDNYYDYFEETADVAKSAENEAARVFSEMSKLTETAEHGYMMPSGIIVPVNPEDGHMYFKSVDVDDALKTIKAVIGDRRVNLNVSWDSGMR